jgi:hypothetical protein
VGLPVWWWNTLWELKKYGNDSRIGARTIRERLSHGSLGNTGTTLARELREYGNDSSTGARRIRERLPYGSSKNTGTTPVRALREYGNGSRTGAQRIRERLPYGRLENTRMTPAQTLKGTISYKGQLPHRMLAHPQSGRAPKPSIH